MKIQGFQINNFLSILLFFILQAQRCDGFASMFVGSSSACWTELRDTESEIIMNNLIKPVSESPHGDDVSIELYDETTMNPIEIKKVGDKRIVYIEDFTKHSPSEKIVLSFLLKLNVKDNPALGDLQYIMDAQVFPELDEDEVDKLDGSEARMTAEFTRNRGCRNMRAYGRKGDKGLSFHIEIPASVFALSDIKEHSVDVVAGWACGHEAVTLTESIEFRPFVNDDQTDLDGKENVEELEQELPAKIEITGADMTSEEKEEDGDEISMKSAALRRRQKTEAVHEIHERKDHEDKHLHLNLKKFNKMYNESRFGQASFSSSSYIKGLLAFLVLGTILIKVCRFKGKKRKGRREL